MCIRDRNSTVGFNKEKLSSDRALVLRCLLSNSRFLRSIHCYPGRLTVINSNEDKELEPIRRYLIDEDDSIPLGMNFNSKQIHSSELVLANTPDYFWSSKNLISCLEKSGLESSLVRETLKEIGLSSLANEKPNALNKPQIQRLSLILNLNSKSKFIIYDRPFEGLSSKWVDKLALRIERHFSETNQIVIITGLTKVPSVWASSKFVDIEAVSYTHLTLPTKA